MSENLSSMEIISASSDAENEQVCNPFKNLESMNKANISNIEHHDVILYNSESRVKNSLFDNKGCSEMDVSSCLSPEFPKMVHKNKPYKRQNTETSKDIFSDFSENSTPDLSKDGDLVNVAIGNKNTEINCYKPSKFTENNSDDDLVKNNNVLSESYGRDKISSNFNKQMSYRMIFERCRADVDDASLKINQPEWATHEIGHSGEEDPFFTHSDNRLDIRMDNQSNNPKVGNFASDSQNVSNVCGSTSSPPLFEPQTFCLFNGDEVEPNAIIDDDGLLFDVNGPEVEADDGNATSSAEVYSSFRSPLYLETKDYLKFPVSQLCSGKVQLEDRDRKMKNTTDLNEQPIARNSTDLDSSPSLLESLKDKKCITDAWVQNNESFKIGRNTSFNAHLPSSFALEASLNGDTISDLLSDKLAFSQTKHNQNAEDKGSKQPYRVDQLFDFVKDSVVVRKPSTVERCQDVKQPLSSGNIGDSSCETNVPLDCGGESSETVSFDVGDSNYEDPSQKTKTIFKSGTSRYHKRFIAPWEAGNDSLEDETKVKAVNINKSMGMESADARLSDKSEQIPEDSFRIIGETCSILEDSFCKDRLQDKILTKQAECCEGMNAIVDTQNHSSKSMKEKDNNLFDHNHTKAPYIPLDSLKTESLGMVIIENERIAMQNFPCKINEEKSYSKDKKSVTDSNDKALCHPSTFKSLADSGRAILANSSQSNFITDVFCETKNDDRNAYFPELVNENSSGQPSHKGSFEETKDEEQRILNTTQNWSLENNSLHQPAGEKPLDENDLINQREENARFFEEECVPAILGDSHDFMAENENQTLTCAKSSSKDYERPLQLPETIKENSTCLLPRDLNLSQSPKVQNLNDNKDTIGRTIGTLNPNVSRRKECNIFENSSSSREDVNCENEMPNEMDEVESKKEELILSDANNFSLQAIQSKKTKINRKNELKDKTSFNFNECATIQTSKRNLRRKRQKRLFFTESDRELRKKRRPNCELISDFQSSKTSEGFHSKLQFPTTPINCKKYRQGEHNDTINGLDANGSALSSVFRDSNNRLIRIPSSHDKFTSIKKGNNSTSEVMLINMISEKIKSIDKLLSKGKRNRCADVNLSSALSMLKQLKPILTKVQILFENCKDRQRTKCLKKISFLKKHYDDLHDRIMFMIQTKRREESDAPTFDCFENPLSRPSKSDIGMPFSSCGRNLSTNLEGTEMTNSSIFVQHLRKMEEIADWNETVMERVGIVIEGDKTEENALSKVDYSFKLKSNSGSPTNRRAISPPKAQNNASMCDMHAQKTFSKAKRFHHYKNFLKTNDVVLQTEHCETEISNSIIEANKRKAKESETESQYLMGTDDVNVQLHRISEHLNNEEMLKKNTFNSTPELLPSEPATSVNLFDAIGCSPASGAIARGTSKLKIRTGREETMGMPKDDKDFKTCIITNELCENTDKTFENIASEESNFVSNAGGGYLDLEDSGQTENVASQSLLLHKLQVIKLKKPVHISSKENMNLKAPNIPNSKPSIADDSKCKKASIIPGLVVTNELNLYPRKHNIEDQNSLQQPAIIENCASNTNVKNINTKSMLTRDIKTADSKTKMINQTLPKNLVCSNFQNQGVYSTLQASTESNSSNIPSSIPSGIAENKSVSKKMVKPELLELVKCNLIKPDFRCLTAHTPQRLVFASVHETGHIISETGKSYSTLKQWCMSMPNFFQTDQKPKKTEIYNRIYYQGRCLSFYKDSYNTLIAQKNNLDNENCPAAKSCPSAPKGGGLLPIVLNLSKMKLLLIGDNEVGKSTTEIDQWADIDKWET